MTKKALVVVDVQNDFLPGGTLAVPHGDQVIAPINRMLQLPFDQIVATRDFHPHKHCSFATSWQKKPGERVVVAGVEQILWPDHCIQDTEGSEFPTTLDTSHFHKVVQKGSDIKVDSYSTFYDNKKLKTTGLEDYLKEYIPNYEKALSSASAQPAVNSPHDLVQFIETATLEPGKEKYSTAGMLLAGLAFDGKCV